MSRVVLGIARLYRREVAVKERHRHLHAAVVRHDDRREARRGGKAADLHHLGEVLVRLSEGVLPTTHEKIPHTNFTLYTFNFTLFLVLRDHLLAAAGIAGQGEGRELFVPGDDPGADERLYEGDESRRVAAGVGDALRPRYGPAPAGKLWEAVFPPVRGSVRGRRVDDDGVRALDERHGLYRRRVGEAQKGDVAGVQRIAPCRDVLANLVGKHD